MHGVGRALVTKLERDKVVSPLGLKSSLSQIFHENTKLTPLAGRGYAAHIAGVLHSPQAQRMMNRAYKVYTLGDQVELQEVEPRNDLERTILARRSRRRFSNEALTGEQLARLLRFSYGRTDPHGRFRAVASGGAVYPLEIYALVRAVEGLGAGIFHYDVEHHRLDVVRRGDCWEEVKRCVWLQDMEDPDQAAVVLVVTALFERTTFKYLDRGYRMVLLEAGEVAQNLALLATSLGLGGYLLGGFYDDALSALLEIDGVQEAPLLPVVLGRPPEGEAS